MKVIRIFQVFIILLIVHLLLGLSQGILFGLIIGPIKEFNALAPWIQITIVMILGLILYTIAGMQIALRFKNIRSIDEGAVLFTVLLIGILIYSLYLVQFAGVSNGEIYFMIANYPILVMLRNMKDAGHIGQLLISLSALVPSMGFRFGFGIKRKRIAKIQSAGGHVSR